MGKDITIKDITIKDISNLKGFEPGKIIMWEYIHCLEGKMRPNVMNDMSSNVMRELKEYASTHTGQCIPRVERVSRNGGNLNYETIVY